jgi:hypothetical protein
MHDQETRTFQVQNLCLIPDGAKAATVNSTVLKPTGGGFLTLFPTGTTKPIVSSINFAANEPALGNGAIVPLGASGVPPVGDLSVFAKVNGGGTVSVVIDVTGYFQ